MRKSIKIRHLDRQSKTNFIVFAGYMLCMAFVLVMYWTFLTAYLRPSKTTTIAIDYYNEANPEWFMLMIIINIILIGLYFSYRNMVRGKIQQCPVCKEYRVLRRTVCENCMDDLDDILKEQLKNGGEYGGK